MDSYIKNKPFFITKKKRISLFILFAFLNILINMDHGTIPAASNEIKNDLNISHTAIGSFGSLVYFGNLVGAFILTKLIDSMNRIYLTIFTTLFCALMIYLFIIINNLYFLLVNRILVGISQSFITIYFPVWIDQYGPKSWKTFMLSIFNVTSPFGVIFGYFLTSMIKLNYDVS
jgi:MFS family permease